MSDEATLMGNLSSLRYATSESGLKFVNRVDLYLQLQCWWRHV